MVLSVANQLANVTELPAVSSSPCSEALDGLRSVIDRSKGLKISPVRPLVLAAEESLHNMVVDLDKVVMKVKTFSLLFVTSSQRRRLLFICWRFAFLLSLMTSVVSPVKHEHVYTSC